MLKGERGEKNYNKSFNAEERVESAHIRQCTWHCNYLYEIWLLKTYVLIEKD